MNKGLKILIIIALILAVISGIFLLTAKKKTVATAAIPAVQKSQTAQATQDVQTGKQGLPSQALPAPSKTAAPAAKKSTGNNTQAPIDHKKLERDQWQQCKAKTMAAGTNLFWNVQISEGIPAGGSYAKGSLDSDTAFPVHVIIKSDSTITDKIKLMLTAGKMAFLRGSCSDVATDGVVVLQAF